jgi:hypothetical protein
MAGLVPAIDVFLCSQDVDARHKAGHDDREIVPLSGDAPSKLRHCHDQPLDVFRSRQAVIAVLHQRQYDVVAREA